MKNSLPITIQTKIISPISKVWQYWTEPEHITKWNNASDDWHTPHAENDLRVGGKFLARMEARDGSTGFNFVGVYDVVEPQSQISYTMEDGRKVSVTFNKISESETELIETFDPESENPIEMQRDGWQAILDNFKRYVEEK